MTGALRLLLLALLGATLVACSSLSYRAADVWLRWNLNGLVSLDGAQERALEGRLDQLLNWHRREQLPRYRQWLEEARAELAEPTLPAARWRARSEELRLFWIDAMARLQPDAVALLADLSDAQVQELVASLREQQEETASEWGRFSSDEMVARREKRMARQLRRWIGRLDEAQQRLVARWAARLGDSRGERLAQRRLWLDEFAAALERRRDRAWFDRELEVLLMSPEQRWHGPYRETVETNSDATHELLQSLHASLTPRQRQHLDKRLVTWIGRFERLAGRD